MRNATVDVSKMLETLHQREIFYLNKDVVVSLVKFLMSRWKLNKFSSIIDDLKVVLVHFININNRIFHDKRAFLSYVFAKYFNNNHLLNCLIGFPVVSSDLIGSHLPETNKIAEAYSEPYQTSTMFLFAKTSYGSVTILVKKSILDISQILNTPLYCYK